MKIHIVSMAPFLGGAEVAAERLGLGLQEAGHEVCILLGADNEVAERLRRANLPCLVTPMRFTDKWHWWRYLLARNAMRKIFRANRPDIVHSNDLNSHQMASDAARGLGIVRIAHHRWVFDGGAIDWFNKFGCDRHFFVSNALMETLCAQSTRLAASQRAVVYDGLPIPPLPSREDRLEARREVQLPPDKVIVTFAGQIIERKGVADLLHAWAMLGAPLRDRAELVVIGEDLESGGRYRVAMQQLAAELKLEPRFAGFQKNVPRWLMASDIAVVPSHVEPLGNATLEAMSYGLPVIGGNVGGIPEMVVPEETGLLVAPRSPADLAQAIERLASDLPLAKRWGENGRRRCEQMFSLSAHTQAMLRQYAIARGN